MVKTLEMFILNS